MLKRATLELAGPSEQKAYIYCGREHRRSLSFTAVLFFFSIELLNCRYQLWTSLIPADNT